MEIGAFNRTGGHFWLHVVLRQQLAANGPESVMVVVILDRDVDASELRTGELLATIQLEPYSHRIQDGLPDVEKPVKYLVALKRDKERVAVSTMQGTTLTGEEVQLVVIREEDDPLLASGDELPPEGGEEPGGQVTAITINNRTDSKITLTLALLPANDGDDRVLTIRIGSEPPKRGTFPPGTVFRQRELESKHTLQLKRLPDHEEIAIELADAREFDTHEDVYDTGTDRMLEIDIIPSSSPADKP